MENNHTMSNSITPAFCIYCANKHKSGDMFCRKCGKKIKEVPAPYVREEKPFVQEIESVEVEQFVQTVETPASVICIYCNNANKPGDIFCRKCGKKLNEIVEELISVQETEASEVEQAVPTQTPIFCVYCANKLKTGDKFCLKCGKKIKGVVTTLTLDDLNKNRYEYAITLIEAAKFEEALRIFTILADYSDSEEKAKLCAQEIENAQKELLHKEGVYSNAIVVLDNQNASEEDIKEAISALSSIADYKDAEVKISDLEKMLEELYEAKKAAEEARREQYELAISYVSTGMFDEAIEIFTNLGEYEDCEAQIENALAEKEAAEEAARIKSEEERQRREHEAELRRIKAQKRKKAIKKAFKIGLPSATAAAALLVFLFTWVIPFIMYNTADNLVSDGEYDKAMAIYDKIGDFSNSEQRIAVINAIDSIEKAKFDDGIKKILDAGVPVKITYGMDGGDFSGADYLSAPDNSVLLSNDSSAPKVDSTKTTNTSKKNEFTYNSLKEFSGLQTPGKNGWRFVEWKLDSYSYQADGTFKLKLKAVWDPKDYDITYDLAGGKTQGKYVKYDADDNPFTLINPTRTGYTFAGWKGTGLSKTTLNVTIPTGSYGDRKYIATWTPNTYTITYDPAGGNVFTTTQKATYDSNIKLVSPTRDGYSFLGWEDVATGNKIEDGKWTRTSNISLIARWELVDYDIQYNLNGGTEYYNPTTYNVESNTINLREPTRTGYTFLGWTYYEQETPIKDVTIESGSIGDMNFTAHWQPTTYTITYNMNGGTNNSSNPTSYTINNSFTLKEPTRTGYTFLGWTYSGQTTPTKNVTVYTGTMGNKTYTANWQLTTYTITYNMNGGTNNSSNPTSYTINNSFTLKEPNRTGYTFLGWTYSGQTTPTKNVTVYTGTMGNKTYTANWKANTYTVTFDANGGTVSPTSNNATYGSSFALPTPTRTGYTFAGWSNGSITYTDSSVIWSTASNTTLTAKWTINTYTVTFNANGGSGAPSSQTKTYGTTLTLSSTIPTRTGYTFLGWATSSSATSASYSAGGSYTNNSSVTLYAVWSINKYTISYNANGGSGAPSSQTKTHGTTLTLSSTIPTRTGYTFLGWSTSSTATTSTHSAGGSYTSNSSTTLYAVWSINTYNITYNMDGGTNNTSNPTSYNVNSSFTLQEPTRAGYTFLGWTYSGQTTPTKNVTVSTGTIGNKTYTANWEVNTYTVTLNNASTSKSAIVVTLNPNYSGATSTTVTLSNGQTLSYPAVPTRNGYAFAGWYTNSSCTTKFNFNETITEDITLYAKWVAMQSSYNYREYVDIANYTTSLNRKSFGNVTSNTSKNYYYFTTYKTGTYTFNTTYSSGDYYISLYNVTQGTTILSETNLWSSSSKQSASATYSANAGDVIYVCVYKYSSNSATGSGTFYVTGASYPTSTATAQSPDHIVYSYGNSATIQATYGEAFTLPTLTRSGYTFEGWYDENDVKVESGTWTYTTDLTLTPKWS